jgi:hypothetical protein
MASNGILLPSGREWSIQQTSVGPREGIELFSFICRLQRFARQFPEMTAPLWPKVVAPNI